MQRMFAIEKRPFQIAQLFIGHIGPRLGHDEIYRDCRATLRRAKGCLCHNKGGCVKIGAVSATCGPSMQVVRWLRTLTGLCRMLIVGVVEVDGGLFDLAVAIDRTYGLTNYT